MSAAPQFVCELIRAANSVDRIDDTEKQRLLNSSVVTIRDMREMAGVPQSKPIKKAIKDLQSLIVAAHYGRLSPDDMGATLLEAAAVIRNLHITLDGKAPVQGAA